MRNFQISFMQKSDIQESAKVLSHAMLNNPLHVAVFQGKGEKERMEIEKNVFRPPGRIARRCLCSEGKTKYYRGYADEVLRGGIGLSMTHRTQ